MSASLDNEPSSTSNEPTITPKLPPHYALGLQHVAITAAWVMVFLFFSYLPLRSTDLWGHTLWGQWILEHRQLPTEDPFFHLAEGMPVVDSAWLSQVTFAAVVNAFGAEGLSALFSLLVIGSLLLLARSFFLLSGRLGPMMCGVGLVLVVGWSRATTLRPENFGVLLLALLVWLVSRDYAAERAAASDADDERPIAWPWLSWVAIPLTMGLWANFHGSYLMGLVFLGCVALGKAIDVALTERSLRAPLAHANVQRWFFLAELGLLATFINPYGLDLLIYNLRFAQNPNLTSILEWQPLVILGVGGREFALSVLLLLVLWRFSRARVTATQVLLLAIFAFASIKSVRMLGWYAPLFAWAIVPHLHDLWSRLLPLPEQEPEGIPIDGTDYKLPPGRSFHLTLLCGLLIWVGFSFAPWGNLLLGGKPRAEEQLFDQPTSPIGLTKFLAESPPEGQTFHPQHWGDWIIRRAPGFRPFITSNIHLAPQQLWADYQRISAAQPGWQRVLDRYRVTTLILDKQTHGILAQAMRQTPGWVRIYDDAQAVVYRRAAAQRNPEDEALENLEPPPGGERPDAALPLTPNE